MIHIYTGYGKGKTTLAFGLAMRAAGHGLKVIIFQFLKPSSLVCGEEISAKRLENIKVVKTNQVHPIFTPEEKIDKAKLRLRQSIDDMMKMVIRALSGTKYKMIILDEVINVLDQNFYKKEKFLRLLRDVPSDKELILTGRGDISELERFADYVTVMIDRKHPFRNRIGARRGIEY